MPKISIIVPVYKVEKYLERCIKSILMQSYQNYELILVDDGSPDNCGNICDEFSKIDTRIKVIHKKNGGLSSARNAGLEIAKGDYIGFVDSDDWITSDMFEHLVELVETYRCEIASCSYTFSNGNVDINQPTITINKYDKKEALKLYLKTGMSSRIADYPVWIKLYKKELFRDIKFPENQLYEDVATNFELIQNVSSYVKSNKICYYYYQESNSITRGGFKHKDMDLFKVGDKLVELAAKEDNEQILKLAILKNKRSYFSALSKIAVYGFGDTFSDEKQLIQKFTEELRKNYWLLIKSEMPINRKIIMTLLCINLNCVKVPIKVLKFINFI